MAIPSNNAANTIGLFPTTRDPFPAVAPAAIPRAAADRRIARRVFFSHGRFAAASFRAAPSSGRDYAIPSFLMIGYRHGRIAAAGSHCQLAAKVVRACREPA
jgi:hypothetical protein